tara:strand:- start:39 stop:533 length:495 start_codon:yes stop_codon:yes gene_type:complete
MATLISGSTGVNKVQTGAIETVDLPAGSVLQVVTAHSGTQVTSSSDTYADSGLTGQITPSSTSSKVLVLISQSISKDGATYANIRVYRGSTEIGGAVAGRSIGYTNGSIHNYVGTGFSMAFQDSPSSTSAVTYKTQFNNSSATGTVRVQVDSGQSYMTLLEIAG